MKRFNLSGWAVSHPTLILFLMIMLGAAGFFSYQRLGRAEDPFFTVKVVNVSAIWPGATAQEMQTQVAEGMRQRLLKVAGVTKVNLYGSQDERIFVEFSHAKLATLGITPQALFDSLAKQNNVTPAGTVETSSQRVPLRVTGALDGAKAVAETPVDSNGRVFRLGDIASVTHGSVDPSSFGVSQAR